MDPEELALALLGIVAKLAPAIGDWLADIVHGSDHPVAVRVRDVLPEDSKAVARLRRLAEDELPEDP